MQSNRIVKDHYPEEGTPIKGSNTFHHYCSRELNCALSISRVRYHGQVRQGYVLAYIGDLRTPDYAYWLQEKVDKNYDCMYGVYNAVVVRAPENLERDNVGLPSNIIWEVEPNARRVTIKSLNPYDNKDSFNEIGSMNYMKMYLQSVLQQQLHEEDANVLEREFEDEKAYNRALAIMNRTNVMMPLFTYAGVSANYVIMPYAGDNLLHVIHQQKLKSFTEARARELMHQILNGLETLQKAGICHRDICLENLVLNEEGTKVFIVAMGKSIKIPYVGDYDTDKPQCIYLNHRERVRCLIKRDGRCGNVSFVYLLLLYLLYSRNRVY